MCWMDEQQLHNCKTLNLSFLTLLAIAMYNCQWEHVNLFSCSFHPEFIQYHHVQLLIHTQFYLPNHDLNRSDFLLFLS
jgi:hypothetical protein